MEITTEINKYANLQLWYLIFYIITWPDFKSMCCTYPNWHNVQGRVQGIDTHHPISQISLGKTSIEVGFNLNTKSSCFHEIPWYCQKIQMRKLNTT
jgi:hypothetical protein